MTLSSALNRLVTTKKAASGASALGGMVIGAIVGIGVQVGVESTGILGPSVDALIAEQNQNFDRIESQLDLLGEAANSAGIGDEFDELRKLVAQQAQLQAQSTEQMEMLVDQADSLRNQSLDERGFENGADVWLCPGESISVGTEHNVMGITRLWATAADINLNGERSRIGVGGKVAVADTDCSVFLKQGRRAQDGRAGFDVVCG